MSFGPKQKTQASQQSAVSGLNLQSSAYGKVIPIQYGLTRIPPNIFWYGDFKSISHTSAPSSGGGKGGSSSGPTSTYYTYKVSVIFGLSEGGTGGTGGVSRIFVNQQVVTPAQFNFGVFYGNYTQTAWGYLTTNHPSQALNYRGVAYTTVFDDDLGNDPHLPNYNFECYGIYYGNMANGYDTDPTFVLSDLLLSDRYGINFYSFAASNVNYDFITYQKYVRAFDLGVSPAYLDQAPCAQIFQEMVQNTNSEFVWSGDTLKIVPYGDTSKTAHGYTYTAPSAPEYSLTDNDFVPTGNNGSPITMKRKRNTDVINSIKMECLDRSNSYNPATIEAKDQGLIDQYGLRQGSALQSHMFCDTTTAKLSVQLQLQREQVRNTYTFKTSQRYILLDPMDIIAISDSYLGLDEQWVRIKEIEEDADGNLTFTCEEYMGGNGNSPIYGQQASDGYSTNYNISAGNVNTPAIFDAPVQLATQGQLEIWIAVSGSDPNWGGCEVHVSADGATYKLAGRVIGKCRQGLLSADFDIGSNPDTINVCSVNLTESSGELLSGTQSDADLAHTLCWVDGELIAYQTAELTATYQYNLKDYITRGLYGTEISTHLSGTQFARLDAGIFKYSYDKTQIGKTFYIKFLSYNIYNGAQQSLSDVSPYTHVIVGPPAPPNVTGFSVTQNGGATVFSWNQVDDFALKGYDILYGPQGMGINTATFLTESGNGTEMTNASVPTGTWTFYIRARDVTDNFSPIPTTFDATIVTESNIVFQEFQESSWLGTSVNFVEHYSGVLIPIGTANSDTYTQISAPSAPSLSTITAGSLTGDTYYVKVTYINQYGSETIASAESSLAVATGDLLVVSSPSVLSGATGYNIYVSVTTGAETLQNPVPYAIGSDWTLPTGGLILGAVPPTINNTGWEVFNIFVVDPVATATYTTQVIDSEFNDTLRVYESVQASMGPGQDGQANILTYIDTYLTGESDPAIYIVWTIGNIFMRYLKSRFILTITPGSVPYITSFIPTADREPKIQNVVNIAVAPGGTTVTFPEPYHFPPFVQAFNANNTALLVNSTNITKTTFQSHMYDTTGADVGGTINYRVTGE